MAAESIVKEVQHSPRGPRHLPRRQSLQSRRSRSWLGCDSAGAVVGLKMLSLGRVLLAPMCMEASNWVRINGQRVGGGWFTSIQLGQYYRKLREC